jgi:LAS superfamily LD-carboxypeptidase LdcB
VQLRYAALRRSLLPAVVVGAVLIGMVLVGLPGVSSAKGDPSSQRDQVRSRRAQLSGQINVLKASNVQIQRALDNLQSNVSARRAQYDGSRRDVAVAQARANTLRRVEAEKAKVLDLLRSNIKAVAVDAYVRGPTDRFTSIFDAKSLPEAVRGQELLDVRLGNAAELSDRLKAAQDDLTTFRKAAEGAQATAEARQRVLAAQLGQLNQSLLAQSRLAAQVDTRVASALAEAAALATVDRKLSDQIAAQQAALASRVSRVFGDGGGATYTTGSVSVTSVNGIVVATSIANQLANLLSAAASAGIILGGSGYRDPAQQIALRKAHCGSAWRSAPASSCHPPTAPPGQSMHERGLAVDFTWNGSIISSHSSPAFRWLAANASRFGFYNLPSEPWHWSTNGN